MASKLTEGFVRSVTRPGKYFDQNGLLLRVRPSGSKQWIWRGTLLGRRIERGLGGYPSTSLAEAQQKAIVCRKLARAGKDPRAASPPVPTLAEAVETIIALRRNSWQPGSRTEAQWRESFRNHVMPKLGEKQVDEITRVDVLSVLDPIWTTKTATARRVRTQIAAVMKWAIARGFRGDNPAGPMIDGALPRQPRRRRQMSPSPQTSSLAPPAKRDFVQRARWILHKRSRGNCDEEYVLDVVKTMLKLTATSEEERAEEDAMGLLQHPEQWLGLCERSRTCFTTFKIVEHLLALARQCVGGENAFPLLVDRKEFEEAYEGLKDWAVRSRDIRSGLDGRQRYKAHTHVYHNRAIVAAMARIARLRKEAGVAFHMTDRDGQTATSIARVVADHSPYTSGAIKRIWSYREFDGPSQETDGLWLYMENYVLIACRLACLLDNQGKPFSMKAFRWYSTHSSMPPPNKAVGSPGIADGDPTRGENSK